MADQAFKDKVKQLFEKALPGAFIDVSDGYRDNVHVVIVSRRFDGLTEREKDDYLMEYCPPRAFNGSGTNFAVVGI